MNGPVLLYQITQIYNEYTNTFVQGANALCAKHKCPTAT